MIKWFIQWAHACIATLHDFIAECDVIYKEHLHQIPVLIVLIMLVLSRGS